MNKKSAFTLAEVLITLGIIGVVAAMTIPTLMNKTSEAQ
nr:type II secretion system protein [bacterium]